MGSVNWTVAPELGVMAPRFRTVPSDPLAGMDTATAEAPALRLRPANVCEVVKLFAVAEIVVAACTAVVFALITNCVPLTMLTT